MTHCARGDEYIVGQDAHTYRYEAGGAAVLGSIQPQPIDNAPRRHAAARRHRGGDQARRFALRAHTLLALENTIGGKVLPAGLPGAAARSPIDRKLAMHLDGARICNAAVKQGVAPREIAAGFDSVSVCLSKGLGAPVGSLLCGGRASSRRRGAGARCWAAACARPAILAAAGSHALAHHIRRLAEDHDNAARLAAGLAKHPALDVAPAQTNMVFVTVPEAIAPALAAHLAAENVLVLGTTKQRWVTHLDVGAADVDSSTSGASTPANFDRVIAFEPKIVPAAADIVPIWRTVPLPCTDRLFAEPRTRTRSRASSSPAAPPRTATPSSNPIKHDFDVVHLAHGVTDDKLAEFMAECDAGINLHNEPYPTFENRCGVYLAAGLLLISETLDPRCGLVPGVHYVECDAPWAMWEICAAHDANSACVPYHPACAEGRRGNAFAPRPSTPGSSPIWSPTSGLTGRLAVRR